MDVLHFTNTVHSVCSEFATLITEEDNPGERKVKLLLFVHLKLKVVQYIPTDLYHLNPTPVKTKGGFADLAPTVLKCMSYIKDKMVLELDL